MSTAFPDFEDWKCDFEKDTGSWFVKHTGKKGRDIDEREYYYCSRSVTYRAEGSGKQQLKSQGCSCIYCTASITVVRKEEGDVSAHICKSHYGHSLNIGHVRLAKGDRLSIAAQLAQGVSFDKILDNIRESVGTDFERIHLVNKKDLYNVERAFNFRGIQKHSVDSVSVASWVAQMMEKGGDSPVLLYKPQGTEYAEVGICNGLREDDFLLVLQTPLQMEMLHSFGNNIICVDATHGTNEYDFMLVSMIVVDDYGEGCPVAWCFTNREDELSLTHFFSHIEQRLSSPIHVRWFMSDDAKQYFSAWMPSFGGNPQKPLCTWHVDRAWQKALSNISENSLKVSVYHTLRVLL